MIYTLLSTTGEVPSGKAALIVAIFGYAAKAVFEEAERQKQRTVLKGEIQDINKKLNNVSDGERTDT